MDDGVSTHTFLVSSSPRRPGAEFLRFYEGEAIDACLKRDRCD